MIATRLINEDRSDIPWRTDGCDTDEQRDILIIEIAALAYLMNRAGLAANGKTGHPSESGRTTGTRHAIKHLKHRRGDISVDNLLSGRKVIQIPL